MNFLKEWNVRKETGQSPQLQVRQNTYYYDCEKEKLSYMRKMQINRVQELLKLTQVQDNNIYLINESLHDVDMGLYLQNFDWRHSNIEVVKFVKTEMND